MKGLEAGRRTCPGLSVSGGLSEVHEPEHLDYYDCHFHSDVISNDVTQAAGADLDIHVMKSSGRVTC